VSQSDPAQKLAREIAREALFLPERERVWVFEQFRQDLAEVDQGQYEIDLLNKRMSQAVEALDRVAEHLGLGDEQSRLALTMRQFDAVPEKIRQSWNSRRVADAMRRSWELAKAIAFGNERLPVVAERQWKYKNQLSRKRREGRFSLTCIHDWLATDPEKRTLAAYDQWRRAHNEQLASGEKAALGHRAILRRWPSCSWAEILKAVEQDRLPEADTSPDKEQDDELEAGSAKASSLEAESNQPVELSDTLPALVLDPLMRGRQFKAAREARDWTINELSEKVGIERSTLRLIEHGKIRQSNFERIATLAHTLGLSLDALITEPLPGAADTPSPRSKPAKRT
jgi:ribosome-binding protein aMBF1 (putative translation factor)